MEDGQSPEIAPFSGEVSDGGPVFNYSGEKLFFYSKRNLNDKDTPQNNIWYVERREIVGVIQSNLPLISTQINFKRVHL